MSRAARSLLALFLSVAGAAAADDPWQGQTAAFLGVAWLDTSAEGAIGGPRDDEAARVRMAGDRIAAAFEAHGVLLVDLTPVADELARTANPAKCYGCDLRMATKLGARYVVVSEVQKVSNLILAMNVQVRDAATGAPVRALAVEIRGNTDESWRRAVDYILEHGIFPD